MPNARGDWWKFSKDSKGKEAKKSGGRAAGILGLYVSLGMGSGQGGNKWKQGPRKLLAQQRNQSVGIDL
jgi:hypothetical protein